MRNIEVRLDDLFWYTVARCFPLILWILRSVNN